jgi:uncharacterized protein
MRIIPISELVETPWKNGGGVTREIARAELDGQVLWRLSMADVATDGPFSDFSGVMRILTVIAGGSMELTTPEGVLLARPGVPVRFDGGLKVESRLTDGPLRDLNLMFDPRQAEGTVQALHGPLHQRLHARQDQIIALHCMTGSATFATATLAQGDTALLETEPQEVQLAEGAVILLITLDLRAEP